MTYTITRRSRSLGLNWTTQFPFEAPKRPEVSGLTPRQLVELYQKAKKLTSGCEAVYSLFIGPDLVRNESGGVFGPDFIGKLDELLDRKNGIDLVEF